MATLADNLFLSISERGMVLERGYPNVADNIVYIGADPGKEGAVALLVKNCMVTYRIHNKQLPDDLLDELRVLKDAKFKARIAIERQGKAPARFASHNADANALNKALRTRELFWGNPHRTHFVKAQVWQDALGVCKPANAHKKKNAGRMLYDYYSIKYLDGMPSDTEDEHAARCILHYSLTAGVWA